MVHVADVRETLKLPLDEKSKISSVFINGSTVYVGLSDGSLLVYVVSDLERAELKPHASLKTSHRKILRRSIDQIGYVKNAGILLLLSDGYVHVFDSTSMTLEERLSKTKGAHLFEVFSTVVDPSPQTSLDKTPATQNGHQRRQSTSSTLNNHNNSDNNTGTPYALSRLLVACKRKLVTYEWRDSEFKSSKDIQTPDRIKSMAFLTPDLVVLGLSSDYCTLDVTSGRSSRVFSLSIAPGAGKVLASGNNSSTGVASYMGLGGKYPTPLCARLHDDVVFLLKGTASGYLTARGEFLKKSQLSWPSSPELVIFQYPFLITLHEDEIEMRNPVTGSLLQSIALIEPVKFGSGKPAVIFSQRQVWRLRISPFQDQIRELAKKGDLDEAIALLEYLEPVLVNDKEESLRKLRIAKATELFRDGLYEDSILLFSRVSAPPETVLGLFPKSISGIEQSSSSIQEHLFASSDSNGDASTSSSPTDSKRVSPVSTRDGAVNHKGSDLPDEEVNVEKDDEKLKSAVRALILYLTDTRRKLSKILESSKTQTPSSMEKDYSSEFQLLIQDEDPENIARLVDTALFKSYILINPGMVGPLVRVKNYCDADVVTAALRESGKYRELIDFLYSEKQHRKALELLVQLGKKKDDDKDVDTTLIGPEPTVRYLERLDSRYVDLIFEFLSWPISLNENYGADVFINDSPEAESLPRYQVTAYLKGVSIDLTLRYLEYITNVLKDRSPQLQEELAKIYIKKVTSANQETDKAMIDELLGKLLKIIQSSNSFDPKVIIKAIPRGDERFLEVLASLYGKERRYEKALSLFVFTLKDYARAESFATTIYENAQNERISDNQNDTFAGEVELHDGFDPTDPIEIYHVLLAMYLRPGKGHEPNISSALELLSNQGSRIDMGVALELLPGESVISKFEAFLRSHIQKAYGDLFDSRILAALGGASGQRHMEILVNLQSRHFTIDQNRTCGVCLKRLGTSVVSVFPNGSVVHYGCADKLKKKL